MKETAAYRGCRVLFRSMLRPAHQRKTAADDKAERRTDRQQQQRLRPGRLHRGRCGADYPGLLQLQTLHLRGLLGALQEIIEHSARGFRLRLQLPQLHLRGVRACEPLTEIVELCLQRRDILRGEIGFRLQFAGNPLCLDSHEALHALQFGSQPFDDRMTRLIHSFVIGEIGRPLIIILAKFNRRFGGEDFRKLGEPGRRGACGKRLSIFILGLVRIASRSDQLIGKFVDLRLQRAAGGSIQDLMRDLKVPDLLLRIADVLLKAADPA